MKDKIGEPLRFAHGSVEAVTFELDPEGLTEACQEEKGERVG
jgi:hypothetical protein